ncbi:MAG: RraA family protein [Candidatus Acidiferrales bacterium]
MTEQKTAEIVKRLSDIPYTGAISDILDEMGFHNQVLPKEIQSLDPDGTVAGTALTILGEPTGSEDPEVIFIPFLKMLGDVKPGNVLVNQPNDNLAAHLGELSAETAQYRGARGAVIDGGARDTHYILKLGFPVFARYKTPVDIVGRWRLVAHNVPIDIGRIHVDPGDYILGDRDGVLVIPKSIAAEVVTKAEEVVKTENLVRKSILKGTHPVDAYRQFGRF